MKVFNEKHEAIISVNTYAEGTHKNGEVVPHNLKVDFVKFYQKDSKGKITELCLMRSVIVDLFNQIIEIEEQVKELPYEEPIPF